MSKRKTTLQAPPDLDPELLKEFENTEEKQEPEVKTIKQETVQEKVNTSLTLTNQQVLVICLIAFVTYCCVLVFS